MLKSWLKFKSHIEYFRSFNPWIDRLNSFEQTLSPSLDSVARAFFCLCSDLFFWCNLSSILRQQCGTTMCVSAQLLSTTHFYQRHIMRSLYRTIFLKPIRMGNFLFEGLQGWMINFLTTRFFWKPSALKTLNLFKNSLKLSRLLIDPVDALFPSFFSLKQTRFCFPLRHICVEDDWCVKETTYVSDPTFDQADEYNVDVKLVASHVLLIIW